MSEIHFKFQWLILLSVILFYKNVYSYHIKCEFPVGSISGTVPGFVGKQEFDKFLKKCGNAETIILHYRNCAVGYLDLPVNKIMDNYPSIRRISWECTGVCRYESSSCRNRYESVVINCNKGKYVTFPDIIIIIILDHPLWLEVGLTWRIV